MHSFDTIQLKLAAFIKKYYTNELIKGIILFFSFGLLYLFFTIFIEYFLWLKPTFRTILFYSFIGIELFLFIKYISIPLVKLFGLKSGISKEQASKIIGKHFTEVEDKLLNLLQLEQNNTKSELLLASIEQKAAVLKPIPFTSAIQFSGNKKYLKYLIFPILIWLVTLLTGNKSILNESLNRVIHYQTAYEPPAPFYFVLDNSNLTAIEGQPFTLNVLTKGDIFPENVSIVYNNQSYFLKEDSQGSFNYTFSGINSDTSFYFESNGVESKPYTIKVIKTPRIIDFKMILNYPSHTGKKTSVLKNSGNTIVPEGTSVTWKINTNNTDSISLESLKDSTSVSFSKDKDAFKYHKRIINNFDYNIHTSNKNLQNYEKLQYSIQVIKDEFPKIQIKTDIDSISRGNAQFVGQLMDDYGISKLNLVYYNRKNKENVQILNLPVTKQTFQEFYYIFPEQLNLEKGIEYEFYFQVFDNDLVNGNKNVKSKIYHYKNKTDLEIQEDILKEQKQTLENLNSSTKNTEKLTKALEEFSNKMKNKADMNWQDKKEFQQFIKRQQQYQKMLQQNTEKLEKNLKELNKNKNPNLEEKKEDLKKRLEEIKEMQKRQKLLDELKKLAEKLDKEGFLKKLDKLTQKNKQDEKSLERILELTKRFYAEKKAEEIANKLEKLAKKQEKLEKDAENNSYKQKEINKKFEKIKEDFKELDKQNKKLKKPMDFPKTEKEQESIEEDLKKAEENLENSEQQEQQEQQDSKKAAAKKKQKSASKKMKKLASKMKQSMMQMQGEMLEEDIDNMRRIIDNLIRFSTDQESLMLSLQGIDGSHPNFSKLLKKQHILKEYFEHIDDSIYTLSLRMTKLSAKIQNDISDAHYNLNQSLYNISENKIKQAVINERFTMTAANNLASLLSDMLDAAQNPSLGQGKGKGKGKGFSLPDIIKKQSDMLSQLSKPGSKKGEEKNGKKGDKSDKGEKGSKKGEGKSEGQSGKGENSEQQNGELYKIYQQQNALRQQFQDLMKKAGNKENTGSKALKQMEELERMLLDKGINNEIIQKMQNLKHELLKLDKALFEQGKDNKRKSDTNKKEFEMRNIKNIQTKKLYFNPNEILNRQALPLRSNYKKKVQEYFSKP